MSRQNESAVAAATQNSQPLLVSSPANHAVTLCVQCGLKPATRKFCSGICRQQAYRQSAAHEGCKAKGRLHRFNRRKRWLEAKWRDKSLGFDGRRGGHENKNVSSLGNFEKVSAEAYLARALQQILQQ